MVKKTFFPLLCMLVLLALLLTGCICKHEWQEATCDTPKTCTKCSITKGKALGHQMVKATCSNPLFCERCEFIYGNSLSHKWTEATCETARTCSVCGKVDGNPPGHTWADATCTAKRTCSVCKKTEGESLGHDWMAATTDAPKTCRRCERTEGSRLIDPRFNKEACQNLLGIWAGIIVLKNEETGIEGYTGRLELSYTLVFREDGSYQESTGIANKLVFLDSLTSYYRIALYAEFRKQGLNTSQANAAMRAYYGMSVQEYAEKLADSLDLNSLYRKTLNGVYYVEGNQLYTGERWAAVTESDAFSIKDNILTIQGLKDAYPNLTLKRVS